MRLEPTMEGLRRVGAAPVPVWPAASLDRAVVYVIDPERGELPDEIRGAGYEVKTFDTAESFLDLATLLTAGCLLIDVAAPVMGAAALQGELVARGALMPMIAIARAGELAQAVEAMKAGVADIFEVPGPTEQLLAMLAAATLRLRRTQSRESRRAFAAARIAEMSLREQQVLQGLLGGGTNKTIGRDLGISPRTVEIHRGRLMERLCAHSLPEVVSLALESGLPATPHGVRRAPGVFSGQAGPRFA